MKLYTLTDVTLQVLNSVFYCILVYFSILQYLRFCFFEMYVSVVFVIRCLYSAVSLTLVREQLFIRINYYYYYYYSYFSFQLNTHFNIWAKMLFVAWIMGYEWNNIFHVISVPEPNEHNQLDKNSLGHFMQVTISFLPPPPSPLYVMFKIHFCTVHIYLALWARNPIQGTDVPMWTNRLLWSK